MLNLIGPIAGIIIKSLQKKKETSFSLDEEFKNLENVVKKTVPPKNSVKRICIQKSKNYRRPFLERNLKSLIILSLLVIFMLGCLKLIDIDGGIMNFIRGILAAFLIA